VPGSDDAVWVRRASGALFVGKEINYMNQDQMEGKWKQFKGKAKEQWGKLTDDDLDVIAGKRDQLIGKVQERYGIAREEAEKQVSAFEKSA
jgi:uncharacterized protein YjbJ (UPF0337 family)